MNIINQIRSCFWQNDEQTVPNQRERNPHVALDTNKFDLYGIKKLDSDATKMEEIDFDKQQQDIQELNRRKDEVIEMMIYVNMMNKIFWRFLEKIEQSAKELDVEYSLVDNIAYCRGKAQSLEKFETFLQKIHESTILGEEKKYDFLSYSWEKRRQDWKSQYFVIPLDLTKQDVEVILYRSRKKELESSYQDNMLTVSANKFNILKFSEWLEEFTECRRKERHNFKKFLENLKAQEVKTKIELSSCDQERNEYILKKAVIIGVECIFGGDQTLEISGRADKVRSFTGMIRSIDPRFPKDFYPKYWDFSIQDVYAEIEAKLASQEFQEIQSLVWRSLKYAALTKLVRIQNQGLMTNYLTTLSSVKNPEARRKRLFYGTEIQEPEKIYKYSKVGFDVSYASFKPDFGKGLHFPVTALYCHGCAYQLDAKTFQVLVADVFVGNSLMSTIKKDLDFKDGLPEGYNSLLDPGNRFVIYDNSQSYPLYLVEYKLDFSANNNFTEQEAEEEEEEEEKEEEKYESNNPSELSSDTEKKKQQKSEFECPLELSPIQWDVIKSEVKSLNLECKIQDSTIQVSGKMSKIRDFSEWLNEFLCCVLMDENKLRERIEKKREKAGYSTIELENHQLTKFQEEEDQLSHITYEAPTTICRNRVSKELEQAVLQKFIQENFLIESLNENNRIQWIVHLIGPKKTPYVDGLFKISIDFPNDYPFIAPVVTFQTKIYHPYFKQNGRIKFELLKSWNPRCCMSEILSFIYYVLCDPPIEKSEARSGLEILSEYFEDRPAFDAKARDWTRKYAV